MSTLTGTLRLARHDVRQDRILVPVWLLVLVLLCFASAIATPGLYSQDAERVRAATALNDNPAIVALYGPILDVHSEGELAMTKMTVLYAVFVAILFVVLVRRHTRVDEESGKAELLGGTAVGRDAPLAAAVTESVAVAVLLGVLAAAGNIAGGLDPVGSFAFGGVWTGTALVAAGIAAVACQLSASARTCAGLAAGTIGLLYALRAVGDTTVEWLSWLTPFGWNTRLSAYSHPRWWVFLLYVALAGALLGSAQLLRARRDLGAGLLATRPGPAVGSPRLVDALTLCLKVHATTIALWTVACGALGLLFGFIAPGLDDLLDAQAAQELIDKLGGLLISAILSVLAVVVSYFAIAVVSHAGSDEGSGRTEMALATATSRARWLTASLVVALGGTLWLLLVTGTTLWVGYASADGPGAGDIVAAALAWAPAVWVVTGLAVACLAFSGRWAVAGWAWPAVFVVVDLVGELFDLPGWVSGVSAYAHVPAMPAEPWSWPAELGLTAVAAAILALAWVRFRQRDIG